LENVTFLVDWLTFSAKGFFEGEFLDKFKDEYIEKVYKGENETAEFLEHNLEKKILVFIREVLKIDNITDWRSCKGMYGYHYGLQLGDIRVWYGGNVISPVCVSMSGGGCRTFESISKWDWVEFLDFLVTKKESGYCNITRVDIACDEMYGYLDMDEIMQYTRQKKYIRKLRRFKIEETDKGKSVTFGSPKSELLIRIYDKAAERGYDYHWIRTEMSFSDERAYDMCRTILEQGDVGKCFAGVLFNYLRFIEDVEDNTNITRCEIAPWWQEFVGQTEKMRIFKRVGIEYNLSRVENYLVHQVAPTLLTYCKCKGNDIMPILDILKDIEKRLNQKQLDLIKKYELSGKKFDMEFIRDNYVSDVMDDIKDNITGFKRVSNLEMNGVFDKL